MRRLMPLLMAVMVACQPIPRPFAEDRPPPRSPILTPPDSAGILVLPVEGHPGAAEAMAAALREADVPASTTAQNRDSYRLSGAIGQTVVAGKPAAAVHWTLQDAQGGAVGEAQATVPGPLAEGPLVEGLARRTAGTIAKLIEGGAPQAAAATAPLLAFRGVLGAPGDGDRALTRAMGEMLRRAQVAVAQQPADKAAYALSGIVRVAPAAGGKQQVSVVWAVSRPDGTALGQVKQDNAVPAGSLDGAWGDVAYAVAAAAGGGITAIIERAKQADAAAH